MPGKKVAVIGGINMDIWGRPAARLLERDSNPGFVRMMPGGVGRNIAHDLRLLGLPVSLVAALGEDINGRTLLDSCRKLGLDMSLSPVIPGRNSSCYLYITDEQGDMKLAINEMDICREISPAYLETILPQLDRFSALVIDANLSEEAIAFLCRNVRIPLYADTVSTAKAVRLLPCLRCFRAIKPNAAEAEALTGEHDPVKAAEKLLEAGVPQVFISRGAEGMVAADAKDLLILPPMSKTVVNTNGAGDAATAAIVCADLLDMDLRQTAHAAQLAGALTCASALSNAPELSSLFDTLIQ